MTKARKLARKHLKGMDSTLDEFGDYYPRLENWVKLGTRVIGAVYGHPSDKFSDGQIIRVTNIISIKDNILETPELSYWLGEELGVNDE